jgi:hypothetical protein
MTDELAKRLSKMDKDYARLREYLIAADEALRADTKKPGNELLNVMGASTDFAVNLLTPVLATLIATGKREEAMEYMQAVTTDVLVSAATASTRAHTTIAIEAMLKSGRAATQTGDKQAGS